MSFTTHLRTTARASSRAAAILFALLIGAPLVCAPPALAQEAPPDAGEAEPAPPDVRFPEGTQSWVNVAYEYETEDGLIVRALRTHGGDNTALKNAVKWLRDGGGKRFLSSQGSIQEIADIGVIEITERPDRIELVQQMLAHLGTKTQQIMIEVQVLEITLDNGMEMGFEAELKRPDDENASTFDEFREADINLNPSSFSGGDFANEFFFALLDPEKTDIGELNYIIRALVSSGRARILSSPRIMTVDTKPATFKSGEVVPVVSVRNLRGDTIQQATIVEKDAGVTLTVTPTMMPREVVQLDLNAKVSNLTGFTDPTDVIPGQPITNDREAKTIVNVRNGQMLIIGGLRKTSETESLSKVPLLGDIPWIGGMFRSTKTEESESEIVFFIRPVISDPLIRGPESGEVITPESYEAGDADTPLVDPSRTHAARGPRSAGDDPDRDTGEPDEAERWDPWPPRE